MFPRTISCTGDTGRKAILPYRVAGAVPTSGDPPPPGCCSFLQTRKLAPWGRRLGQGWRPRRALHSVPKSTVSLG